LREAARLAENELTAQRGDLESITKARTAGHAQQALELSATFRARHPRAGAALVRLPLPGRIRVVVSNLEFPTDLVLNVDGAPVPLLPAAADSDGEPTAEAIICRNGDRETAFDVTADGFTSIRQVIPGSTMATEKLLTVGLKPAPIWSVTYANPGATATLVPWVQSHILGGGVMVQHRDGVLVLRSTDGAVSARLERQTSNSPAFARLWYPIGGTKMLLAQDDGTVQLVAAATLIPERSVHRGTGEPLAWADLDLALQNGKRIHAAIERIPGVALAGGAVPPPTVVLVAQDGDRLVWKYDKLRSLNQIPQLISHDDRLYVFDDAALHLLEEDGTVVRVFTLPATRIGAVVELPQLAQNRRDLLVPTSTGTLRLQFGNHQDPVRLAADPVFAQAGPAQLAVFEDHVLFVNDKMSLLARFSPAGAIVWKQEQTRPLGAMPTLSAACVAIADDKGTVSIRARATGQILQRVVHGTPLAGPPLIIELATGLGVMVCDRAGVAAAYRLRK